MERIWISGQGKCKEEDMPELLRVQFLSGRLFVAYFSDGFMSGKVERHSVEELNVHALLELRIFDQDTEFLARRSSLSAPFNWRAADDQYMCRNFERLAEDPDSGLPFSVDMLYSDRTQILDINEQAAQEISDDSGNVLGSELMTTVGGRYFLPVMTGATRVLTKTYYYYDAEGMARAEDFRLCGFE